MNVRKKVQNAESAEEKNDKDAKLASSLYYGMARNRILKKRSGELLNEIRPTRPLPWVPGRLASSLGGSPMFVCKMSPTASRSTAIV